MTRSGRSARTVVRGFLQGLDGEHREVADGEWGLVLDDVGGRPLEVGLRLRDGLLALQAWVAPPGIANPHRLLHRNRLAPLVRYAHASAGDVHVHVELPEVAVTAVLLDRVLGGMVEAALWVRQAA
jgi:hypothetical protein